MKLIQNRATPIAGVTLKANNVVSFAGSKKKEEKEVISSQENTSSRTVSKRKVNETFTRSPSPSLSNDEEDGADPDVEGEIGVKKPSPLPVFKPAGKALWNQNKIMSSAVTSPEMKGSAATTTVPIIALTPFSKRLASLIDVYCKACSSYVILAFQLDHSSACDFAWFNL